MKADGTWGRGLRDRFGTVRIRTTTAAVLVVGIALLVGATALVVTLRRSLEGNVEGAARLRAQDVAAALDGGTDPATLQLRDSDESFVQVLDAGGRVVASSPNVAGVPPVTRNPPGTTSRLEGVGQERDDPFLVVSISAGGDATLTVIAGRSLDPVEESSSIVARILLLGIPLLLVVVAITTWAVVGKALRFVESIRSQVAQITSSELHRRVPDPPGSDEISRLAETMNAMLARLEAEQHRRRRFISDASHELRSPVATIRNQAEVALAHPARADAEELAKNVLAEDLRLEKLVDDLLVLARADEDRDPLNLRPINIDDIVLEEARRLRDGTSLVIDTAQVSAGRAHADQTQMRRVVRNLADNAARHASSLVRFTLHEDQRWVVLLVDDDGPGVPIEHREKIFHRFTRLDAARDRDHGGSGLGLAIVFESIQAHGGAITVAESPIGGARFEVRVPVER